jgi:hypothetical protein
MIEMKGRALSSNVTLKSELSKITKELRRIDDTIADLNSEERRVKQTNLESQVEQVLAELKNVKNKLPKDASAAPAARHEFSTHINRALYALSLASDVAAITILAAGVVIEQSQGSFFHLTMNIAIALIIFAVVVVIFAYLLRTE